jgi:catechol 2,3-dioxygenase
MSRHLIRQMGYLVMQTPDPEGSASDLVDIVGVRITARQTGLVMTSSNERMCEIAYRKGKKAAVEVIGLEAIDSASVDEAGHRAKSDGLEILDDKPTLPGVEKAIKISTPFGPVFEVHTPIVRNQTSRYKGGEVRPRRFEHVNTKVQDTHGLRDMLTNVLGMKVSDRANDDAFVWLRAADGFHHTVALGKGNELHHYAFDAYAIEDLVKLADTLDLRDRDLLWGPGRHGAGDNIFTYYRDPNGCVVETSFGMMRIDNDEIYEIRDWSKERPGRLRNCWGPPTPQIYFENGLPFRL